MRGLTTRGYRCTPPQSGMTIVPDCNESNRSEIHKGLFTIQSRGTTESQCCSQNGELSVCRTQRIVCLQKQLVQQIQTSHLNDIIPDDATVSALGRLKKTVRFQGCPILQTSARHWKVPIDAFMNNFTRNCILYIFLPDYKRKSAMVAER